MHRILQLLKVYFFAGLVVTSFLLTACGTKGPLYIPEQRYPQKKSLLIPKTQKQLIQSSATKSTEPQNNALKANIHAASSHA